MVVIFDLDGTLIDSRVDIARAMNAALAALGHPTRPEPEIFGFIGRGVRWLVERSLPEQARAGLDGAVAAFRAEYERRDVDVTRPFPGIPEALDALAARAARCAVLTNKPGDAARRVLGRLGLEARFALVLGGGDVPEKPDPRGLGAACARLGVPPPGAWYVGDLPLDVEVARAAGCRAAAAGWGYGEPAALERARPDRTLAAPMELSRLLD